MVFSGTRGGGGGERCVVAMRPVGPRSIEVTRVDGPCGDETTEALELAAAHNVTGIVCEQVSVFGTKVADPSEFAILSITAVQNVLVCFEMSALPYSSTRSLDRLLTLDV